MIAGSRQQKYPRHQKTEKGKREEEGQDATMPRALPPRNGSGEHASWRPCCTRRIAWLWWVCLASVRSNVAQIYAPCSRDITPSPPWCRHTPWCVCFRCRSIERVVWRMLCLVCRRVTTAFGINVLREEWVVRVVSVPVFFLVYEEFLLDLSVLIG